MKLSLKYFCPGVGKNTAKLYLSEMGTSAVTEVFPVYLLTFLDFFFSFYKWCKIGLFYVCAQSPEFAVICR